MNPHPRPRLYPLQLRHRPQYPLPYRVAAQVARLKQRIRPHGISLKGVGGPTCLAVGAPAC